MPNAIPLAPAGVPLLGHTIPLLRNPLTFLNLLPAVGDLVRIRIGPFTAVIVCDPELTRQVLRDDRTFDKGGFFIDKVREFLGDGLGTCPHERHRRQRRLLQPAFHPSQLSRYAPIMSAHAAAAANRWKDGQILDVVAETLRFTSQTTMATMLSDTLPPQVASAAIDDFATIEKKAFQRMFLPDLVNRLPTPGRRHYDRAIIRLRGMLGTVISNRRADPTDHHDLLSMLLAAQDPAADITDSDPGLSDTEVCDQLITFFMAGSQSTATLIAWALHLVAAHPDVERRLHTEVDAALPNGTAAPEHLAHLRLTSHILTETLRLYPPAWIFTRELTAGTRLGGHHLPAGSTIIYSPYLIHHRNDLYEQPHTFDPDRWAPERTPPARNALIPFGSGARRCIGDVFATTAATLALATITARWTLRPVGAPVRPAAAAALTPRYLRMRATIRSSTRHRTGQPTTAP